MKINFEPVRPLLCAIATFVLMAGCGSEDTIIDVVDSIDTEHHADVNYINILPDSITFYAKSTVYPNSVYDAQHRVTEVLPARHSDVERHDWINGAKETEFAIKEANSGDALESIVVDLTHNHDYWTIAYRQAGNFQIEVFEKSFDSHSSQFVVRVFTNADLAVSKNQQVEPILELEAGEVSGHIAVAQCDELFVGEHFINLCQTSNIGSSYLVVLDNQSGRYVVAEE